MSNAANGASAPGRGVSGVEVLVKWGERTLERAFVDGKARRNFRLGGEGCDFYAHPRWLGANALELVALRDGEAVVHGDATLERGAEARWDFGPLTLEARWAVAPRATVVPLADRVDYLQLNILIAVAAAAAMGIGGAIAYGVENGDLEAAPEAVAPRFTKFVTQAEKKPNPVKATSEAVAEAGSPKAPRPEGASGEPSPHRKAGRAAPGHSNDNDKARDAIAKMFAGKSVVGLTGGTGLGAMLTAAVGGMERTSACAGPSCSGLGLKGDGNGGGGLDRDLGSFGLRTQGRAGNSIGYGVRPDLRKTGTGAMPECLIDPKTGKCQDSGPHIDRDPTMVCGEKGAEGLGCLDKELIRKVIRANLAGVRACYERALLNAPSLDGKVSVKFTIGLEGNVPTAVLAQSTVGHPQLESCVVDRMKMLHFPRSRGMATVTYPFIFHTAGK